MFDFTLLHYRIDDGTAIIYDGINFALAIPPYERPQEITLSKGQEIHAQPGFATMNLAFDNWDSLRWLLQTAKKSAGIPMYSIGSLGPKFLRLAMETDLYTYLYQIENELIPKRHWQYSAELLFAIMRLPNISGYLFQYILSLLGGIIPYLPMAI
jgi:hypothetical protein